MRTREQQLAMNEAWFREINDRIEANALRRAGGPHVCEFVCECANIDCAERMRMTLADYEQVRSDPTQFAILPEHDRPETEAVVLRNGFWIVRKTGPAAGVVAERD